MKRLAIIFTLAAALGTTGCSSMKNTTDGVLIGGAVGAAAGVGIAAVTAPSIATGALIGAAVGVAAGAYTGCKNEGKCD
jgi:osmotically inducible lipoprotein OsmB